jgi:hypothetical protein
MVSNEGHASLASQIAGSGLQSARGRANLRFADVEASGRADIIWMDKYTGASTVFKNDGFKGAGQGPGESSFQWTNRGILYSGISRGENLIGGADNLPSLLGIFGQIADEHSPTQYFTNQGG